MPKKSKKVDKKTKKKVVIKKVSKRQNPNAVRRIPAIVGQRSSANITEVVAPSGARGGVGSYNTRTKKQIEADKIKQAKKLLGITNQPVAQPVEEQIRQPSIQRNRYNVRPQDLSSVGGYTGLTSGYGVKESSSIEKRLKEMEQRLKNEIKKDSGKDTTRNEKLIEEVSSRRLPVEIATQTEIIDVIERPKQPSQALIQSQQRARQRNYRNQTNFGFDLPTDKQVKEEKEERQQKELVKEKERTKLSLFSQTTKSRKEEQRQQKQEQEKQKRNEFLKEQREKEEFFKQRQDRDNAVDNILDGIINKSVNKSERKQRKAERKAEAKENRFIKESSEKEDEVIGSEINRANVSKQNEFPKVEVLENVDELIRGGDIEISGEQVEESRFSDLSQEDKISEIMETQEDIAETGKQLIEELDDTEFSDVIEKEPRVPPKPADVDVPLFIRGNRPLPRTPKPERPLPKPPVKKVPTPEEIKELRQIKDRQKDIERIRKEREELEKTQKKNLVKDVFTDIVDSSFDKATKKAKELAIQQKAFEREQRKTALLKRDKEKQSKQSKNIVGSIVRDIVKESEKVIDEEEKLKEQTTKAKVRSGGQGRKPIDKETTKKKLIDKYGEVPEDFNKALEDKEQLEKEKAEQLQQLISVGVNDKVLGFNVREFTKVLSLKKQNELKKELKKIMKFKEVNKITQNKIMVQINNLLKIQNDLRQSQNLMRDLETKLKKQKKVKDVKDVFKTFEETEASGGGFNFDSSDSGGDDKFGGF
tara:strand:- start:4935 stop:7217 length:2283 start_codon:yes stop_codon:yes gene_type:complete